MLVIKPWNVMVEVTPVAFGYIVGNTQVVKSRQEHHYVSDEYRNHKSALPRDRSPTFAGIAPLQEGANDNEKATNQKQHYSKAVVLHGIPGEVSVAILCA